jgi:hypothetical protein
MVLPPLATRAGKGWRKGPAHAGGGTGCGAGLGGVGCVMVVPKAGGAGRLSFDDTRPLREGAVSTRGMPIGPSPRRSEMVLGMLACECQVLSIPCHHHPQLTLGSQQASRAISRGQSCCDGPLPSTSSAPSAAPPCVSSPSSRPTRSSRRSSLPCICPRRRPNSTRRARRQRPTRRRGAGKRSTDRGGAPRYAVG